MNLNIFTTFNIVQTFKRQICSTWVHNLIVQNLKFNIAITSKNSIDHHRFIKHHIYNFKYIYNFHFEFEIYIIIFYNFKL